MAWDTPFRLDSRMAWQAYRTCQGGKWLGTVEFEIWRDGDRDWAARKIPRRRKKIQLASSKEAARVGSGPVSGVKSAWMLGAAVRVNMLADPLSGDLEGQPSTFRPLDGLLEAETGSLFQRVYSGPVNAQIGPHSSLKNREVLAGHRFCWLWLHLVALTRSRWFMGVLCFKLDSKPANERRYG
jgi:hypothetical protein